MKTTYPALFCAVLLLSSCAPEVIKEKTVRVPPKEFKHKLELNNMGCWEFERNPEYVPTFEYGNAVLGVGGTYIECMKTAISMHEQAATSLTTDLAKVPPGTPEAAEISARLKEENALIEEGKKTYLEWRKRNWK